MPAACCRKSCDRSMFTFKKQTICRRALRITTNTFIIINNQNETINLTSSSWSSGVSLDSQVSLWSWRADSTTVTWREAGINMMRSTVQTCSIWSNQTGINCLFHSDRFLLFNTSSSLFILNPPVLLLDCIY